MGFCGRCGELVKSGKRCVCGGSSKTPTSNKVLGDRAVTPEQDRWHRQYVSKSPGGTPRRSITAETYDAPSQDASNALSSIKAKHLSLPTGLATSSRAASAETASAPVFVSAIPVEQVEETINRAFGSVLDPLAKRQKWSCTSCGGMFVRDQTVYPDPRARTDPNLQDKLYCPGCFADHFSLGDCVACRGSVLPDAAAPFIQRKDKLWHSTCYTCLYCSKDLSKTPQVDLYGNPCCSRCFDNAAFLKAPTIDRVPALLSADQPAQTAEQVRQELEEQKPKNRFIAPGAARLGPAVNELRSKLERAGFDDNSATPPSPSSPTLPMTSLTLARPVKAPIMSRTQSEQPSRPAYQRHRSANSVTIPAAFSQPSSPVMPTLPNMQLQAEPPRSTPLPQGRFPRPQRTGRSHSAYDVPSAEKLRAMSAETGQSRNTPTWQMNPARQRESPMAVNHTADPSAKKPLPVPPVGSAAKAPGPVSTARVPATSSLDSKKSCPGLPPAVSPPEISADSRCAGCKLRLFSMGTGSSSPSAGNRVITLPSNNAHFHARCFVCASCKKGFEDGSFVELDEGKRVHEKCAPPMRLAFPKAPSPTGSSAPVPSRPLGDQASQARPFRNSTSSTALQQGYASAAQMQPFSPSKTQVKHATRPPGPTKLSKASEVFASRAAVSSTTFGGMYTCAGCGETGTMAETTLGPVGTRFHHRCLKCNCGKRLDSGAKSLDIMLPNGETKRKFACRDCIDKDRLSKRSVSSISSLVALRAP